jgi:hypothetical protein
MMGSMSSARSVPATSSISHAPAFAVDHHTPDHVIREFRPVDAGKLSASDAKTPASAPYRLAPSTHSVISASMPFTMMLRNIFVTEATPISRAALLHRRPVSVHEDHAAERAPS